MPTKYYVDFEFDGHNDPLISFGIVSEFDTSAYVVMSRTAKDPWVQENVLPILDKHDCDFYYELAGPLGLGAILRKNLLGDKPIIIADSPVDIYRFCQAISTDIHGNWAPSNFTSMKFEVHNVNCYPNPKYIQHNAWHDALALKERLQDEDSISRH